MVKTVPRIYLMRDFVWKPGNCGTKRSKSTGLFFVHGLNICYGVSRIGAEIKLNVKKIMTNLYNFLINSKNCLIIFFK